MFFRANDQGNGSINSMPAAHVIDDDILSNGLNDSPPSYVMGLAITTRGSGTGTGTGTGIFSSNPLCNLLCCPAVQSMGPQHFQ